MKMLSSTTILSGMSLTGMVTVGLLSHLQVVSPAFFLLAILIALVVKYIYEYRKSKAFLSWVEHHPGGHQVHKKSIYTDEYIALLVFVIVLGFASKIDRQTGSYFIRGFGGYQLLATIGTFLIKRNLNYYGLYFVNKEVIHKSMIIIGEESIALKKIKAKRSWKVYDILANDEEQLIIIRTENYENSTQLKARLKALTLDNPHISKLL